MNHLMIDLETLSLRRDAAILSIGAVVFDPKENVIVTESDNYTFHRRVNLVETGDVCRGHIDAGTVMWWLEQSEDARQSIIPCEGDANLVEVLFDFSDWLEDREVDTGWRVWAKDPDFDLVVLNSAFDRIHCFNPIHYSSSRSVRTMLDLASEFGIDTTHVRNPQAHNALQDAIYQARLVTAVWQGLA